jgi:hypothetical protein
MNGVLTNSQVGILCSYINRTCQLQIIKVFNLNNGDFERVIFPGQRVLFYAEPEDELEVYAGDIGKTICVAKYPCIELQIDELT